MQHDSNVAGSSDERIVITYKPHLDAEENVELEFNQVVISDFTFRLNDQPVAKRNLIPISQYDFDEVMKAQKLSLSLDVKNCLSSSAYVDQDASKKLQVKLDINNIEDFHPSSIVQNVPELKKLLQIRSALETLQGPMGNVDGFLKLIHEIIDDPDQVKKVMEEMNLVASKEDD